MSTRLVCILASAALLLWACHADRAEMRRNAQAYLEAMGNYRFEEAIPYATRATRELTIEPMIYFAQRPDVDTNFFDQGRPATISLQRITLLSDSTARVYYHKHTPIDDMDDSLTLRCEGGHWLAEAIMHPFMRSMLYGDTALTFRPHIPALNEEIKVVPSKEDKHSR